MTATIANLKMPPGGFKQLEGLHARVAEARAATTKAEISFMDRLRKLTGLRPAVANGDPETARAKAVKPKAPKATRAVKKAIKARKGKMPIPGAGSFKCLSTDCDYHKHPFKAKMHAVLHARATKHRIDWGKDGKPQSLRKAS